jgi:hypothetical protein
LKSASSRRRTALAGGFIVDGVNELTTPAVSFVGNAQLGGNGEGLECGEGLLRAFDRAPVDGRHDIAGSEVDPHPDRVALTQLHDSPAAKLAAGKKRLELEAGEKVSEAPRKRRDDVATP